MNNIDIDRIRECLSDKLNATFGDRNSITFEELMNSKISEYDKFWIALSSDFFTFKELNILYCDFFENLIENNGYNYYTHENFTENKPIIEQIKKGIDEIRKIIDCKRPNKHRIFKIKDDFETLYANNNKSNIRGLIGTAASLYSDTPYESIASFTRAFNIPDKICWELVKELYFKREYVLTLCDLLKLNPCYSEERLMKYYENKEYYTLEDVLSADIPVKDKYWLLCVTKLIDLKVKIISACEIELFYIREYEEKYKLMIAETDIHMKQLHSVIGPGIIKTLNDALSLKRRIHINNLKEKIHFDELSRLSDKIHKAMNTMHYNEFICISSYGLFKEAEMTYNILNSLFIPDILLNIVLDSEDDIMIKDFIKMIVNNHYKYHETRNENE